MLTRRNALISAPIGSAVLHAATANARTVGAPSPDNLPRKKIDLVRAPGVHAHEQATREGPKIIEYTMVIQEKQIVVDDDGTKLHAFTYDGDVPGPLMVVHEGDYVELTLVNPATNTLAHNIDFHASTGALGGGALTHVNPGEQVVLRWKATRPGVYIYHCAPGGAMIPWHVVCGMNGVIMVLPRDGLKDREGKPLRYDRLFYIVEQDMYIPRDAQGNYKTYETPTDGFNDMMEVMRKLIPSHIVFNGKVGSLTGDNALTAKVGENVLIVHGQANRDTRPHLIGGHGDYVWATGKFNNPPEKDLETWFIPGGCAGAALYKFLQPGLYTYLNHNLIEAVLLGAAAHVKVEGTWDNNLMQQMQAPGPIPAARR